MKQGAKTKRHRGHHLYVSELIAFKLETAINSRIQNLRYENYRQTFSRSDWDKNLEDAAADIKKQAFQILKIKNP